MQYFLKILISALLIVLVSEIAKRSTILGALLASIPLVSLLGMVWLYVDTGDSQRVAALAADIFWLVIPSLALFAVLPLMIRHGFSFWTSLATGVGTTALAYALVLMTLRIARA